jgi:hypothetical protein
MNHRSELPIEHSLHCNDWMQAFLLQVALSMANGFQGSASNLLTKMLYYYIYDDLGNLKDLG